MTNGSVTKNAMIAAHWLVLADPPNVSTSTEMTRAAPGGMIARVYSGFQVTAANYASAAAASSSWSSPQKS
jgi:hypothetical protein